jgi:hypothetical protein
MAAIVDDVGLSGLPIAKGAPEQIIAATLALPTQAHAEIAVFPGARLLLRESGRHQGDHAQCQKLFHVPLLTT